MNARQLSRLFTPRITVLREPELKAIGARIRHERERLGFSHDEVSLAFAPTMLHMHVVETGERPPSTNLLYWLALAGADVSFILSGNPASETASTDLGRFFDELPIADAPDATARLAAVQEKAISQARVLAASFDAQIAELLKTGMDRDGVMLAPLQEPTPLDAAIRRANTALAEVRTMLGGPRPRHRAVIHD